MNIVCCASFLVRCVFGPHINIYVYKIDSLIADICYRAEASLQSSVSVQFLFASEPNFYPTGVIGPVA